MTPSEFKCWFEGYTENIDKQPTHKQWERIKTRVGEIDNIPVTERIFVDRWWQYQYPYRYAPVYTTAKTSGQTSNDAVPFNSSNAMYALGVAEAAI